MWSFIRIIMCKLTNIGWDGNKWNKMGKSIYSCINVEYIFNILLLFLSATQFTISFPFPLFSPNSLIYNFISYIHINNHIYYISFTTSESSTDFWISSLLLWLPGWPRQGITWSCSTLLFHLFDMVSCTWTLFNPPIISIFSLKFPHPSLSPNFLLQCVCELIIQ